MTATEATAGTPPGLPGVAAVLGRARGENFTVASRLLPATARRHLLAFYGYARFVDQIGDAYAGDRLGALDWLERDVRRGLAGAADTHPLVGPATAAVLTLRADPAPLLDLIEANRRDQQPVDVANVDELLAYCRLSAAPVGRLVLAAFRAATDERVAWSDAVCAALQLAEHWQDVAEDRAAGRVYLPADDRMRFGVGADDLLAGRPATTATRALLAFEVDRARRLLRSGEPLVASLTGRPRLAVAGFVAGGHAALDALVASGCDPLTRSPRPTATRTGRHLVRLLTRAGAPW
ncbi:MAG TPA: squalene synthase HpnC [Acidimicrobiales bacterium]|nr:squalene synthase HpnC [Acidimicrobiales bacterium]